MKVTAVVRTCNRPEFLKEALASIQLQTHTNWEVLIFDDSGADVNFSIYKSFKEKNSDKRVMYMTTQTPYDLFRNSWIYPIDLAEGEIIVRLDDDDIFVEDCFQFLVDVYSQNNELDFSFGSGIFFQNDTLQSVIGTKNPFEHPKTRDAWAPYTIPNNKPWVNPWAFIPNYYKEPQPYTSIIHAAKANQFSIYHTYVLRTSSLKKIKDKITVTSKFVDDLEFLGTIDYLGLGFNSIKKILCYVRIHTEGRVTDHNKVVDNTNIFNENFRIRDKVDELRPSGFYSKVIPIENAGNFNDGITATEIEKFKSYLNRIKDAAGNPNFIQLGDIKVKLI